MENMFYGAVAFNQPLAAWDVSNVTNFAQMFRDASVFNQAIPCWNVANATDMTRMLNNAVAFDQNLSAWCVGNNIATEPTDFDSGSGIAGVLAKAPQWGVACSPVAGLNGTGVLARWDVVTNDNLWADVGKTLPVGVNGIVAVIEDSSGNGNDAIVSGNVRWRNDSSGNGYLDFENGAQLTAAGITDAYDIAFVVPGVGNTYIERPADAGGAHFWGQSATGVVGSLLITSTGNGSTVGGFQCLPYQEKVTTSLSRYFRNEDLFNNDLSAWDMNGITDVSHMFEGADFFENGGQPLAWDTSTITDMSYLFRDCIAFNQDITGWVTSAVTDMSYMFNEANAFNQDIGGWDVSAVTVFTSMLQGATVFNQDLSGWTTTAATRMDNMFRDAVAFNSDVSNFDMNGVTRADYMFSGCTVFNNAGISLATWDVSTIQNFSGMFNSAEAFDQDITTWTTTSATAMANMFTNAKAFNRNITGWDVANVTSFYNMFRGATLFNNGAANDGTEGPVMNWDVTGATDNQAFRGMFQDAVAFNCEMPNWVIIGLAMDMMNGCAKFNQDISSWDLTATTYLTSFLRNCAVFDNKGAALTVNAPLCTHFNTFLAGCSVFNQDVTMVMSSATNTAGMFQDTSVFNGAISGFDMSGVTNAALMFSGAAKFNQPIGDWEVQNIQNFLSFLSGAAEFNQKLTCWDVGSATNMNNMFSGTTAFDQDISTWCTPSITAEPTDFKTGSGISAANEPNWATMGGCTPGAGSIASGSTLAILDPRDKSNLFQDVGMTNPVTTAGQTVLAATDSSGNGNDFVFVDGTVTYREDTNGNGMLEYGPSAKVRAVAITSTYDVGFIVPTVGYGYIASTAIAGGAEFGGRSGTQQVGPMIFTASGFGNTVSGTECISYASVSPFALESFFRSENNPVFASNWDLTNITSIDSIFFFSDAANASGVETWTNTGNLVSMRYAFNGNSSLNQDLSNFDTSNVQDFFSTFSGCSAFTGTGLSSWDVGSASTMASMFNGCINFNEDLSLWNVINCNNFDSTFSGCRVFNNGEAAGSSTKPLAWDINTTASGGVEMESMFKNAWVFNQDITTWNMSNVDNMLKMFQDARAFNNGNAAGVSHAVNWDTTRAETTSYMFDSAWAFNGDISSWDTSNIEDMSYMFQDAQAFNQNVDHFDFTSIIPNAGVIRVFKDAVAFNNGETALATTAPITWTNLPAGSNLTGLFENADSFNQDLAINWANVTSIYRMFYNNGGFNRDVNGWDVSGITSLEGVFYNATAFNNGSAGGVTDNPITWDTSSATTMEALFRGATSFDQDVSGFNLANVTTLRRMFRDADNFNQPVGSWDVSGVSRFDEMFEGTDAFNQSLGCWDVSGATNMDSMFEAALGFNQSISGWCTPNITVRPTSFADASPINGTANEPDWTNMGSCTPGAATLSSGSTLALFDPRDMTSLYQDTARTIPVTAPGDSVRGIADLSGNGNHGVIDGTAARYREDVDGKGFLDLFAGSSIKVATVTVAYDVGFIIPGIGNGWEGFLADAAGAEYWGKNDDCCRGPLIFTGSGFGSSMGGAECIAYAPGTVSSLDRTFSKAVSSGGNFADWNTTGVTRMEYMFEEQRTFTGTGVENWDVSAVTSFQYMFDDCDVFNADLSAWDTSSGTLFRYMFNRALAFNNGGAGNDKPMTFDTSSATDLSGMFFGNDVFNQDVAAFNTANATTLASMFNGANAFNQDVNHFDLTKCTNIASIFQNATVFNNGSSAGASDNPLSWSTPALTITSRAFASTQAFNQDLSSWTMDNVWWTEAMFNNADAFNQNLNAWNMEKMSNAYLMFWNADIFNNGGAIGAGAPGGDAPLTWTTTALSNAENMFASTGEFNQPMPNFAFAAGSTTRTSKMFQSAPKFNQDISMWDMSNVTRLSYMFQKAIAFNNGSAPGVTDNPLVWDTSKVITLQGTFAGAESFNQDIESWDTSSVTNMNQTFSYTSSGEESIFNRPLNKWNVSSVTNFEETFARNRAFNQPLACWNVSAATNMAQMFESADAMDGDLSAWCTPNITAEPTNFVFASNLDGQTAKHPDWANMASCTPGVPTASWPDAVAIFDMTDVTTLYQDAGMTTPVTAAGQSVAKIEDLSGNGNHMTCTDTTAKQDDNGNWYICRLTSGDMTIPSAAGSGDFAFAINPPSVGWITGATNFHSGDWGFTGSSRRDFAQIMIGPSGTDNTITGIDCGDGKSWSWASAASSSDRVSIGRIAEFANVNSDISNLNMRWVFDAERAFSRVTFANPNVDLSGWNMAAVEDMQYMFNQSNFAGSVENWDASSCTSFEGMFYFCADFNGDVSGWTTNTTGYSTKQMFGGCTNFNSGASVAITGPDLSNLTSATSNCYDMFRDCTSFNCQIPTVNIIGDSLDAAYMFRGCSWFQNGGVAITINGDNARSLISFFDGCTLFNQPVTVTFPTNNLQRCQRMFYGCQAMNSPVVLPQSNATTIVHTVGMFQEAINFDQDMSYWCVSHIASKPTNFATNAPIDGTAKEPQWGAAC
ncbi:hypothetical protein SM033_00001 [Vibrio phage vB_VpaM_sm033]|nr:hypothetical protein SM033_00001 [Vibrio phage vB_VpaM_sm033]